MIESKKAQARSRARLHCEQCQVRQSGSVLIEMKVEKTSPGDYNTDMNGYANVLDSADRLSLEEQEQLAATLQRRVAERRRAEIVAAVKEARTDFVDGKVKPASPAAIFQKLVK